MSKKKNTLKNLDEFLKQQAANLVSPERLTDRLSDPSDANTSAVDVTSDTEANDIVYQLKQLINEQGMDKFYDTLIETLDSKQANTEDMMLINTALYLKNGDAWQAAIQNYWRDKA